MTDPPRENIGVFVKPYSEPDDASSRSGSPARWMFFKNRKTN